LDADRPEYRRLVKDVHDGRYGLVLAYTPMVVSRAAAEVRFFAAVCSGLGVRTLLHAGSELPEGSPLVAEELFRL
jgi:predicted SnoaL-like aldol condensation-catalyzing enzyme